MKIINILKISFLYIGTVIGAGFATGKELTEFFKNTSFITIILGGIALGLFLGYYLYLGKTFNEELSVIAFNKYNKVFDFLVFLSTFFVFVSMFDTSNIILQNFNIKFGGYYTIIFTLISAILGISFIKKINFLVIPCIIVMVILIYSKNPKIEGGSVNFLSPILYAGMNIMLAGFVIKDEGKNLTNKQIVASTVVTSVILSFIMVLIYQTVKGNTDVMPLFSVAKTYNLKVVAGIVIYCAILTTALSSAIICLDYLSNYTKSKIYSSVILFLLAIPFKIYLGFEKIVKFVYPIVSILGILVTILSFIKIIKLKLNKRSKNI